VATWSQDQLLADVERLALRALPYDDLHRELTARLRRAMAIDAACWHGLDPDTLLLTTANPQELLTGGFLTPATEPMAAEIVVRSEYLRADYNSFASLAHRRTPVGILSLASRSRPERSARWNEYLSVVGTPYEMRGALVSRGRAWGCVVLHRTERSGDFGPDDARLLALLSRPIAEAMHHSLRADAARRGEDDAAPGLLVLDRRDEVLMMTERAGVLLQPLLRAERVDRVVPVAVLSLAAATRSAARAGRSAPAVHVPTVGGWITLHGSVPDGALAGAVAVIVQPTQRGEAAPLRLQAYGLTPREREVALLVAQGLDTGTIAARLYISPYTVQDHLKMIFAKTDTNSRRELRARVFFSDQLPTIVTGARPDQDGHLRRAPESSASAEEC
jgi:DNA-binding CsgD family transcriptional regulator